MSALAREPVPDASLAARLHARIARDGPLTVEEFMQACLSDEAAGVYASRQPIGGKGDFITSPEISQIFGELVGLWAVAVWQSMGEPSRGDRRRAWTWAWHSDGRCFPRLARRSEIPRQRLRGADRDEPRHGRGAAQDPQGCGRTASLVCGARRGAGRPADRHRQRVRRCAAHPAIHPPRRGLARTVDRERRRRRLHLH